MDKDFKRASNITVIVAGIIAFAWLFFKYALAALCPFIFAAIIAALVSSSAKKLSRLTKMPEKIISTALALLFFGAIAAVLYFSVSRLLGELYDITSRLSSDPDAVSRFLDEIIARLAPLGERFSFIKRIIESEALEQLGVDLDRLIPEAVSSLTASITEALPSAAMTLFKVIPDTLLFVAVLVISTFYFAADGERIASSISSLLPEKWAAKLPVIRRKIYDTLISYVKAYLVIMLMTFCEVFLGLSILGVRYAFVISLVIAVVDILPILGTGSVVVPWAIFSFATSNYKIGIGLLVIYGAVSLVRQIAEPKIVGNSLGLHPLATLASVYIGVKTIGFAGIFIGPVVALLAANLFRSDSEPLPKTVEKDKHTPNEMKR